MRDERWYRLRREIPFPEQIMAPELVSPETLRDIDCPHCLGRSYVYDTVIVDSAEGRKLRTLPCQRCGGTGLVCPTCRALRRVKVPTGDTLPRVGPCPKCCDEKGAYNDLFELASIEEWWRRENPF